MGVIGEDDFEGGMEIEPCEDASPPHGRRAVHYGTPDPLFDSPASTSTHRDHTVQSDTKITQHATTNVDTEALISYLEATAKQMEEDSGERDEEIRDKIASLRSILASRSALVEEQVSRLAAISHASDPVKQVCDESIATIERSFNKVDELLRDSDTLQEGRARHCILRLLAHVHAAIDLASSYCYASCANPQMLAQSAHYWVPAVAAPDQETGP